MNHFDRVFANASAPDPDDLPNTTFEYGNTCATMNELPIVEDVTSFVDEDTGYDPYNSGAYDSSKWRGEKA